MKLIIDIPEDLYAQIYSDAEIIIYGGMRSGKTLLTTLLRSIRNGIPLDDVKAEIEHMACRQYEYRLMLDRQEVIEILDNIGKAESEK